MKAIWKESIGFELVNIPIKLYSAKEQSTLDLDMVDKSNMGKIHFQRVNEKTGREVKWEDIGKAYELDDDRFRKPGEWSDKYFNNPGTPEFRWSGQVMEPVDGLAFIGKDPENSEHFYTKSGDSGMGITHSAIAGIIIRDLITGKTNIQSEIYKPYRITFKAAFQFLKDGANTVSQYPEHLTPGDIQNEKELAEGEGAIIRDGFDKVAVYKDTQRRVHKFSAYCTHLKCVLDWNKAEKSRDCPCHGSRSDCTGKVLNGPAIAEMKKV